LEIGEEIMSDVNVELNVHELGILLSALQELDGRDERRIAREYGSVSTLYEKLYEQYKQMDSSQLGIRYETIIEPSF
jgi:hypothetical protein